MLKEMVLPHDLLEGPSKLWEHTLEKGDVFRREGKVSWLPFEKIQVSISLGIGYSTPGFCCLLLRIKSSSINKSCLCTLTSWCPQRSYAPCQQQFPEYRDSSSARLLHAKICILLCWTENCSCPCTDLLGMATSESGNLPTCIHPTVKWSSWKCTSSCLHTVLLKLQPSLRTLKMFGLHTTRAELLNKQPMVRTVCNKNHQKIIAHPIHSLPPFFILTHGCQGNWLKGKKGILLWPSHLIVCDFCEGLHFWKVARNKESWLIRK